MRAYIGCALLIAAFGSPRTAFAWTDARVTAVRATVDVRDPDVAQVALELRLEVRSGWLSSLDLDDLDPDLELLTLDAPSGTSKPELVRNLPGHLGIRWSDRRSAPGPGEHALRVVYATRQLYAAAQARGLRRLAWTLPAWPVGLSQVEVRVLGPPGLAASRAHAEPNSGEQIRLEPAAQGGGRVLTYTRAVLPRTQAWTVRFELPPSAASETASSASQAAHDAAGLMRGLTTLAQLRELHAHDAWSALFGAALGILAVSRRRLRRAGGPRRALLLPWLESPRFDLASLSLCTLAPVLLGVAPNAALAAALLGVATALEHKRACPEHAADSGQAARPAGVLGAHALLGASTPAGAVCRAAVLAAGLCAPEPLRTPALLCGWLALPLLFNAQTSAQTAFLRKSSTTASRSFSSRPTASGAGSKSTSAAITSS